MTDNRALPTLVPDHFLPEIGLVMVRHAFMDRALTFAIIHLAKMDGTSGISILSGISTGAKVTIFENLIRTKIRGQKRRLKMLVIASIIRDTNEDRNAIAHRLPYSYSPSHDELTYFRDVNLTYPQIKVQPPVNATISSLNALSDKMFLAAVWLNMFRTRHPEWKRDTRFPWCDELRKKEKEKSIAIKKRRAAK